MSHARTGTGPSDGSSAWRCLAARGSGGHLRKFRWASGALAATLLTDYAVPADEAQVWRIWEGNARQALTHARPQQGGRRRRRASRDLRDAATRAECRTRGVLGLSDRGRSVPRRGRFGGDSTLPAGGRRPIGRAQHVPVTEATAVRFMKVFYERLRPRFGRDFPVGGAPQTTATACRPVQLGAVRGHRPRGSQTAAGEAAHG